jgi:hypothetical protein
MNELQLLHQNFELVNAAEQHVNMSMKTYFSHDQRTYIGNAATQSFKQIYILSNQIDCSYMLQAIHEYLYIYQTRSSLNITFSFMYIIYIDIEGAGA